jgi:molybdenum transport protein
MMCHQLPDREIERFIEEDLPYGDLTTSLLGIGDFPGEITFTSRENTTLCCTEEAARVLELCGASVTSCLRSGTTVDSGVTFLIATGSAASLHAGWKAALNLLEYASGIATRTSTIINRARAINPDIKVVTTRKSFPGTKKIAIKAIMAGGALPHRLGLSESILVFRQHMAFLGGSDRFPEIIVSLKAGSPEHKIMAEAESQQDALILAGSGADVIQIDKLQPDRLTLLVEQLHTQSPNITISAAGGINAENAAAYAATGVDILVLSSVYFGKPSDIAVSIHP